MENFSLYHFVSSSYTEVRRLYTSTMILQRSLSAKLFKNLMQKGEWSIHVGNKKIQHNKDKAVRSPGSVEEYIATSRVISENI